MKEKRHIRNIPENRANRKDRFRVQFKSKKDFEVLVVTINRILTGEVQVSKFKSNDLPDKGSIYFTTFVINGRLTVQWKNINPMI